MSGRERCIEGGICTDKAQRAESEEALELRGDFEVLGKFSLTGLDKTLAWNGSPIKLVIVKYIDVVRNLDV